MICKKCGKENQDNSQVCYFCGDNLTLQRSINNNQDQNNELLIFGVPLNQTTNNTPNLSNQKDNSIKFESTQINSQNVTPSLEENQIQFDNKSSLNNSKSSPEIIFSDSFKSNPIKTNNLENLSQTLNDDLNLTNNSKNNDVELKTLANTFTNEVENNKNDAFSQNNISNNIALDEKKEISSKKKKNGNGLFVFAIILVLVACSLIIIPFFTKETDRLKEIDDNSKININNSGEIKGTISINSKKLTTVSNYYKINDVYNVKFELTNEDNSIINIYMNLTNNDLNIYIPSEFIDLFGTTKSDEIKWIKYSINFVNEIDLSNYTLAELFDSEHYKYVNDVNDTKHYRLKLDDKIITTNNINEYLFDKDLEIYADKNNFLSRITAMIPNIGSNQSLLDIDIRFSDSNEVSIVIPNEAIITDITLESYIENNKI